MRVALVTDSTSDLNAEQAAQLGVEVVPLYVNFQGKIHKDWLEIGPTTIFDGVKAGAAMPSSSQPSPADFKAAFERALQKADHVLVVLISSKLSGTVGSANLAAQDFPGKITVFDSLGASMGEGMMIERANEMFGQGASMKEVLVELERIRADHIVRFTLSSLDFLKKNGRIGGAQALLGGLLGIKPILTLKEGKVEAAGRARGDKKALAEMVDSLKTWAPGRKRIRIYYLYNSNLHDLDAFKALVRELGLPLEERATNSIGGVLSTHTGPGVVGLYAYSL